MQRYIDHTLLKPDAQPSDITKLCAEAVKFNFFSVCVNSSFVAECKNKLAGSDVKVCSVVGFPLGAMSTKAKAFETQQAIADGAEEIDMVIHIGHAKAHNWTYIEDDIRAVVLAASGHTVKVILETSMLTDDEKVEVCKAALNAKAHFVKTSTGFGGGGATVEDVQLMKKVVGSNLSVKASGGIRDLNTANKMIEAGATRLGTSSGIALINGTSITQGAY